MSTKTHWSEATGQYYYIGTVEENYEHITHDVEAEELGNALSGMLLLWKSGRSDFAPTTRVAWELLMELYDYDSEDPEPVCVGRVVDGWCVPIGVDEEEEEE